MTFLFWNLNRKRLEHLIAEAVYAHSVDVLMLAENEIPVVALLEALNCGSDRTYFPANIQHPKVTIISRLPEGSIVPLQNSDGITARHLKPPLGRDIMLVVAHLPSKLYRGTEDQNFYAGRIARIVDELEKRLGHARTLIVGDLNMNPFEAGVAAADTLHGVMSRRIAAKESRTVQGQERQFFYNPMWTRFGDNGFGPPGTYYYNSSKQVNYFWNLYDQVLLRPCLLDSFQENEMKILTQAGSTNLLNDSFEPNVEMASDHLPLLFKLHL